MELRKLGYSERLAFDKFLIFLDFLDIGKFLNISSALLPLRLTTPLLLALHTFGANNLDNPVVFNFKVSDMTNLLENYIDYWLEYDNFVECFDFGNLDNFLTILSALLLLIPIISFLTALNVFGVNNPNDPFVYWGK